MSALVPEQGSQRRPARIEHGLGHRCPSQGSGVDVADEDRPVLAHQTVGELVQVILSAVGDLRVDRLDPALLAGSTALEGILFGDLLNGLHRQRQTGLGGALQERPEVEAGEEAALALPDLLAQFITVVPDQVRFAGALGQPLGVAILDAQAKNDNCLYIQYTETRSQLDPGERCALDALPPRSEGRGFSRRIR